MPEADSEGESNADEDEIWAAMKASMPKDNVSDEEDSDGPDDLSMSSGDEELLQEEEVSDAEMPAFEDEEDLFDSDEEVQLDGPADGSDEEDREEEAPKRPAKRQRLRNLPTFAAAEDYEHLLL